MNRTLTILADGEPVTGYARARLLGTERMGLYCGAQRRCLRLRARDPAGPDGPAGSGAEQREKLNMCRQCRAGEQLFCFSARLFHFRSVAPCHFRFFTL